MLTSLLALLYLLMVVADAAGTPGGRGTGESESERQRGGGE